VNISLLHVSGNPQDRLNPFAQIDYTALRTYAMLVNQAPTFLWDSDVPRHVPARHFVAWFQFLGEVISDTYNAGLASVLSSPRYGYVLHLSMLLFFILLLLPVSLLLLLLLLLLLFILKSLLTYHETTLFSKCILRQFAYLFSFDFTCK
jgi:hypothetical protein